MTEFFQLLTDSLLIDDIIKRDRQVSLLYDRVINEKIVLTNDQCEQIRERALKELDAHAPNLFLQLSFIACVAGDLEIHSDYLSPFKQVPSKHPRAVRNADFTYDLFKKHGVVDHDEEALYCDAVFVRIGSMDTWRQGSLYLTDRRLLISGPLETSPLHNKTVHRLHYDNLESRPYLSSLEILDLASITKIEPFWKFMKKEVDLTYRTKYYREKGSTLYGPLWLKWERPPQLETHVGDIQIDIVFEPLPPPPKISYQDFRRKRQETFVAKLKEVIRGL